MKAFALVLLCSMILAPVFDGVAQVPTEITLEGIWKNGDFNPKRIPGFRFMNDGEHYTRKVGDAIVRYTIITGEAIDTIFNGKTLTDDKFSGNFNSYTFSSDEQMLLIKTESERVYRRSTKAYFFVYDRSSRQLKSIGPDDKIMHCTFSPDGRQVAYVYDNNMYARNLAADQPVQFTSDGEYNNIINGSADWVYEEEFGFTKAFEWSPDSKRIAFMRFDESAVREFSMDYFNGGIYPDQVTFKYPKVDETNAIVSVNIHDLEAGKTATVDRNSDPDGYIPRIKWTKDPNKLCVFRLNRHQNHLELLLANASTGSTSLMLDEKNKYYFEITDDLTFLEDGKRYIWTSEGSGYNHVYLNNISGEPGKALTSGEFDVTAFYGIDEVNGRIYYQAAKKSPMSRQLYTADLNGKSIKELAGGKGTHSAQFSSTFDYYVRTSSTINTAASYTVFANRGNKEVRVIENNAGMKKIQESVGTNEVEFFTFETEDDVSLNGWMLKPDNFDKDKQYPVFMYLYGGPGSQQVVDNWRGANYWWFQMLAKKGFIVACIDNRGTGARGEEFRKMTYMQLGKYETIDQINAAKYLGSLPYTDASRIGIFGWSYGGYMSSLCLLKGNDVFKSAIAVAPVTNWKWYDSIYTERFMRGYSENKDGYDENAPINFVDRLKGDYLLVHGLTDDNVHWQHTAEMANALIGANKQFDTYFYPNRSHGIGDRAARLHLFTKMTNFITENLGDKLSSQVTGS